MRQTAKFIFMAGALGLAACDGETSSNDAAVVDSAVVDSGAQDSGAQDSGAQDSGTQDSGAIDSGTVDAGAQDSGTLDSGATDAGGGDVPSADVVVTDAPGADAGDAPDPYFCIGRVPTPMAMGTMATLSLRARNFSNNMGMPGLTVKACARTDATCMTPHSMGTTDAMGLVTLTFPLATGGFDGYFEFTGGAGAGAVTPTRTFFNPPITATMSENSALLVPLATFTALGGALGGMLDDTHGAITFGVGHCLGAAQGAAVAVTPTPMGATAFYNVSGLPDPRATATDMSGQGGLLNVPPGDYTLTGSRVSPMTRIGSVAVSVRGRFVTAVNVVPSP